MKQGKLLKKQILSVLLALAMIIGTLPLMTTEAHAEDAVEFYYLDTSSPATPQVATGSGIGLTTQTAWVEGTTYVASGDVTIASRISVNGTDASPTKLVLLDGASLTASSGINVASGEKLEIYAGSTGSVIAGTGTLTATTSGNQSLENYGAIGVDDREEAGTIIIYGGTVNATSGEWAPGIGGGYTKAAGTVSIYGGTVNATGGNHGAGIGSGSVGQGESVINIYGGTVNAKSLGDGAGIGGGQSSNGANVTISGGMVNAIGGSNGAKGIGRGGYSDDKSDGTYTLGSGMVAFGKDSESGNSFTFGTGTRKKLMYAMPEIKISYYDSGRFATGSLYGYTLISSTTTAWNTTDLNGNYVASGNVTISGRVDVTGNVKLVLLDGCELTVTGGINVLEGNTLNIYSGNTTSSISGSGRLISGTSVEDEYAGIGGDPNYGDSDVNTGTVNVYGGTVTATGGGRAAGIGGGYRGNGGTVNIYDGTVTANGGINAAGIGGGMHHDFCGALGGASGTINILGGTVNATGGTWGAGIGGGTDSDAQIITISGGTVNATGGKGGAGIGGGFAGDGGTITISGEATQVTATGGEGGAGIGAGERKGDGTVSINGGTVTANGGSGAEGIGKGANVRLGDNTLSVGTGMVVKGGDSADPTTLITPSNGSYARYRYMVVEAGTSSSGHTHVWTITKSTDGTSALIDCTADGCNYSVQPMYGCRMRVYLYAESILAGNPIPILISYSPDETAFTSEGFSVDQLEFAGRNSTVYSRSTTKPTEPGEYTAFLKVNVGSASETISDDFRIAAASGSGSQDGRQDIRDDDHQDGRQDIRDDDHQDGRQDSRDDGRQDIRDDDQQDGRQDIQQGGQSSGTSTVNNNNISADTTTLGTSTSDNTATKETEAEKTENYTIPMENKDTVQVEAKITEGVAEVNEITQKDIDSVVKNVSTDKGATSDDASEEGKETITIDLSKAKREVNGVVLTKKSLDTLAKTAEATDNSVETVTIKMKDITVKLDAKTMSAVAEQAKGEKIRLVVENTEAAGLNNAQKEALTSFENPDTFEAYFESNGSRIHDFKGGTATVSRKYTLAKGQKAKYVHIYYVSPAGELERQATTFVDEWLTALIGHFSEFAVVYDENMENETGKLDAMIANGKITGADKAEAKLDLNADFKVTASGKKVIVEWGKVEKADRYDIYAGYCGNGKAVKIRSVSGKKLSTSFSMLDGTKLDLTRNVKVYVVAYSTASGKDKKIAKTVTAHIVGTKSKIYSNVAKIELKKSKYSVEADKTFKIKASTVLVDPSKKALTDAHAPEFRYATTDKNVAKVDKTGKVTAVGKGTCYIWIYARNGMSVKVKVTVK